MKRWRDQLKHEAKTADTMREFHVTRLNAPFVDSILRSRGDFLCVLAMKGLSGKQYNYAMRIEAEEVEMMGLDQQSRGRELMPDCENQEELVREKRHHATEYLARQIAAAMMDYLEKNDPQFGYSTKEWEDMKK